MLFALAGEIFRGLFTGDLVTKLVQVGACVGVGEADADRGLQEHEVGLCSFEQTRASISTHTSTAATFQKKTV
jgi:hypothetical protein